MGIYKKIIKGVLEFPDFLQISAKDIIRKLLNPDHKFRLGCKDNGESIMRHNFYEGVCFEDVFSNQIEAPWIPKIKNYKDTTFFEEYPEEKEEVKVISKELDKKLFSDF
jgi:hypothetical protein